MNIIPLDELHTRAAIQQLEDYMRTCDECTTDFDEYTEHHFGEGTYVREMRLPKHTLLVGKIHRFVEVAALTKGILLVKIEGVAGSKIIEAPYVFTTQPGRKVGYVLEDVIILNIHPNPTNTTDLDQLERELTAADYLSLEVVE